MEPFIFRWFAAKSFRRVGYCFSQTMTTRQVRRQRKLVIVGVKNEDRIDWYVVWAGTNKMSFTIEAFAWNVRENLTAQTDALYSLQLGLPLPYFLALWAFDGIVFSSYCTVVWMSARPYLVDLEKKGVASHMLLDMPECHIKVREILSVLRHSLRSYARVKDISEVLSKTIEKAWQSSVNNRGPKNVGMKPNLANIHFTV